MTFPKASLPTASLPWTREVEKQLTAATTRIAANEVNNSARDSQLNSSLTRVNQVALNAQEAATNAQAAIDGLTSLGSIDSEYTINAGNINAGTLTGVTIQTATTGTRTVLNGTNIDFYYAEAGIETATNTGHISSAYFEGAGEPFVEFTSPLGGSYVRLDDSNLWLANTTGSGAFLEFNAGSAIFQALSKFTGGTMPTSWQNAGEAHIAGGSLRLAVNGVGLGISRPSSTGSIASFQNGSTQVGSISITASATAYNTSSDYRLKDNVVPLEGSLERLMQLKPSRFGFKAEPDKIVDGFIAHEVAEVIPEAIYGEKDGVDEEGNPEYQGIDQSKIVPLLTAAVQELAAKVATLEGK